MNEPVSRGDITIWFSKDGQSVDIRLSNDSDYGEWIQGEGGDICIYRRNSDDRLNGVHLPFYGNGALIGGFLGEMRLSEMPEIPSNIIDMLERLQNNP